MTHTPDEEFVLAQLFEDLQNNLEFSNGRPSGLYARLPYLAEFDLAVNHAKAVMKNEERLYVSEFVSESAAIILPNSKAMAKDLINTFRAEEGIEYLTNLELVVAGLGYTILYASFSKTQKELGRGVFSSEEKALVIDSSLSDEAKRETIARLIGRIVISIVVGEGESFDNPFKNNYTVQKWCNDFSYDLLMPAQFVRDLYMQAKSFDKMRNRFKVTSKFFYERLIQLELPLL